MRDAPAKSEARLLVVDDEPTILELLAGTLRFAGFDVLTAVSGAEALRAAAAARPDLILLAAAPAVKADGEAGEGPPGPHVDVAGPARGLPRPAGREPARRGG